MASPPIPEQSNLDPTPESVFFGRRRFVKNLIYGGVVAGCWGTLGYRAAQGLTGRDRALRPGLDRPDVLRRFPATANPDFGSLPPGAHELTDELAAGTHNNFYEFIPGGGGPVYRFVDDFIVDPWAVVVTGEVHKPRTFGLEDLFKFEQEERIYRFRCVETWAMVVPWTGFPLRKLLKAVEPKSSARHVRFITANRRDQMPGMDRSIREHHGYQWPYHEGLRIDEALNDLTLLATGVYGRPLPKQHGAPVRLVVPWKYGYKSPKSIVRIELVREQPPTFWAFGPYKHEYGYLSNVNPNIPHPRWSQATDHMLTRGASPRSGPSRKTEIFNGYGKHVAQLYPNEPKRPQQPLRPGQVAR